MGSHPVHASSELGISQRRADWLVKWTLEIANSTFVNMSRYEEGLGRIMYVVGALECEKPFLGPLYRFLALHPRGSIRRVPLYISFIPSYLSRQIARCRHFPCAVRRTSEHRENRDRWLAARCRGRRSTTRTSLWCSHEITQDELPWIYERSGKPSLMISSLEALAVIVALKIFFSSGSPDSRRKVDVIPTWTDNRGNGSALNKLMSTRFPASALLMELATHMKEERIKANVHWAPRETNCEADRLANGNFEGFSPEYRIPIDFSSMQWYLLGEALSMGRDAELAYEFAKQSGSLPGTTRREKRKRQDGRLRFSDPW